MGDEAIGIDGSSGMGESCGVGGRTESKLQVRSPAAIASFSSNTGTAPMLSSANQAIVGPEVFM